MESSEIARRGDHGEVVASSTIAKNRTILGTSSVASGNGSIRFATTQTDSSKTDIADSTTGERGRRVPG